MENQHMFAWLFANSQNKIKKASLTNSHNE